LELRLISGLVTRYVRFAGLFLLCLLGACTRGHDVTVVNCSRTSYIVDIRDSSVVTSAVALANGVVVVKGAVHESMRDDFTFTFRRGRNVVKTFTMTGQELSSRQWVVAFCNCE
jgi:hypothetical protein